MRCGPAKELESERGNRIRGLRVCQNETCGMWINRDRNGAANIAHNCMAQLSGGDLVGKNAPKEDTELVSLLASLVVCD